MPPEARDRDHLEDMLRHAREALSFTAGKTYEDYLGSRLLQLAVERAIEILGEAARRVSPAFRETHPVIPWAKILSQRNVLAHEYGEVDPALIWGLLRKHLPELVESLEQILDEG